MALFDTAIGRCGVAWGERGLLAVALPHARDERTLAGLRRRAPGAIEATPPPGVDDAVDAMVALLDGESSDLTGVELDLGRVPYFDRRVAAAAREIPPGATLTYGELATRIGAPGEAREVGRGAGAQPVPARRPVPPHRGGRRAAGRLLGPGRHRDQAAAARDRASPRRRPPEPLRRLDPTRRVPSPTPEVVLMTLAG